MSIKTQSTNQGLPRSASTQQIVDQLNIMLKGKLNATLAVTLNTSTTQTTITDARLGPNSFVWLMPLSADAKTALANIWFSGQTAGACTVNHNSSSASDMSFRAVFLG